MTNPTPGSAVADFAAGRYGWRDFRRAARRVPPTILHGMMAAAVLCVLLPAFAQVLQLGPSQVRIAPPLPAALAPEPPRSRCPGCGVVEAIRAVPEAEGMPAGFEFTVRLRDGSVRTSAAPGRASWQVGDRIILIGGAADPGTR